MLHDFLDRGEIVIPAAVGAGKMEDILRYGTDTSRLIVNISGDLEAAKLFFMEKSVNFCFLQMD